VLEQFVMEYRGFSARRGRCHVLLDRELASVLVGDPSDNPGTSVTNAIERVAYEVCEWFGVNAYEEALYQYVPWEPRFRRELTSQVEFEKDAWAMPTWTEADQAGEFLSEALDVVRAIQPYQLTEMTQLEVVNGLVRLRIEAGFDKYDWIAEVGTIEHISQRRVFYVDVAAGSPNDALSRAREQLSAIVDPELIQVTRTGAPLDRAEW